MSIFIRVEYSAQSHARFELVFVYMYLDIVRVYGLFNFDSILCYSGMLCVCALNYVRLFCFAQTLDLN